MIFRHPTAALCWIVLPSVSCLQQAPGVPSTIQASAVDESTELGQELRGAASAAAAASSKYLVASFPNLRQVAYVHLPDNVWRPFVIDQVARPSAVAVDSQRARLFVSDQPNGRILWYQLARGPNGLLETGPRRAAVEGYNASWLACNAQGDLYFVGRQASTFSDVNIDAIYRQDAANIVAGYSTDPAEVYSRYNSGSPNATVWSPTGVAVDSFMVYWGNQEGGLDHGSVVRGGRQNLGAASGAQSILKLSTQMDAVRNLASTGTHIFYVAQDGVYGLSKSTASTITHPHQGRIALAPPPLDSDSNVSDWSPTGVAWDGDSSIFLSDASAGGRGKIYSLPSLNLATHNLTTFVEAPGIYDIAIMDFTSHVGMASSFAHQVSILPGAFLLVFLAAVL